MACWASLADAQVRPPNFSPDNIPETSFTCEDKITGGYYADIEAECQLFHVCVQVSEFEVSIVSYLFIYLYHQLPFPNFLTPKSYAAGACIYFNYSSVCMRRRQLHTHTHTYATYARTH